MAGRDHLVVPNQEDPAITIDRSSSLVSAIAVEICGGVIAHMVFAIVFGIFLTHQSYYPNDCQNSLLYIWAEANFYYFVVASVLTIIVSPLMIWTMKKYENSSRCCHKFSHWILNFIRFGVGFMAIFLWIGLCAAYSKSEEDCGGLGTLVFAYIIFVSIAIFLGCCFLMGLCCILRIYQKSNINQNDIERSQEFERMN